MTTYLHSTHVFLYIFVLEHNISKNIVAIHNQREEGRKEDYTAGPAEERRGPGGIEMYMR